MYASTPTLTYTPTALTHVFTEPTAPVLPMTVAGSLGLAALLYMQRWLDAQSKQQQQPQLPEAQAARRAKDGSCDSLIAEGMEMQGSVVGNTTRVAEA